jgi:predicted amidophosphoribosyltransferase
MWEYNFQVEQLISAINYKGKFSLIPWVAKLSTQFLESRERFTNSWDLILPVPSKTANSEDRGYNPVALFVRKLGKHLSIPTATTALIISDSSPNRARLSIAERSLSPSPVISLNKRFKQPEELLKNKKVLLVDDVLTTGATASAAASVLSVCSRVDLFTIARSSRFTANRLSIEHQKQFRNDVFQEIA